MGVEDGTGDVDGVVTGKGEDSSGVGVAMTCMGVDTDAVSYT